MAQDGRQARWTKHNEERRTQILDAAIAVIEEQPAGAEFHVQQIAERAGLNRTVVYRHFTDRTDLDLAIRARVLDDLTQQMLPALNLDGSINEIIRRIISTYVDWTVEHPTLHTFAVQDTGGAVEFGLHRIASALADLLEIAIAMLGADLDADEEALVDPLAHGLVGAVFATVLRWLSRKERVPDAARLAELLSMSVWNLLDGHIRRLGLEIDPDLPMAHLLNLPEELLAVDGDGA
ncbi:TetR/AcrR family transcriptional regulator [Nocardioides sp.]|uniref:TetR/AcrR family transcriptional regulator n=1 Tax=Nocardioides sp. TaxID=35761 RepID=UPI003511128D